MLQWLHTNPYKISLVHNFMNQAIFRRICMESVEHICGNISPTICTNILIFCKDTFLVLISQMILTNPTSSQILIFVTSHFTTPLANIKNTIILFVSPPNILHKHCFYFLLGLTIIPRKTGNNAYAKCWVEKQRVTLVTN